MVKFTSFKSTIWVLTVRWPSLQLWCRAFHHPRMFLPASFLSVFPCTSAFDNHWSPFCHCSPIFLKFSINGIPQCFRLCLAFTQHDALEIQPYYCMCSWPSISLVLVSWVQPTTYKKYSEKKFQKAPKNKTGICPMPATIFIWFTLGIINNLLLDQIGSARLRPWSQCTDTRLWWREVQHLLLSKVSRRASAQSTWSPVGFSKAFLKARWKGDGPGCVISSLIGWWWG